MTREQIEALAQQLLAVAAAVSPGHAGTVAALRGLVAAGSTLHELIGQVRAENPDAWTEIAEDFQGAHSALRAAVEAADARDGTS